MANNTRFARIPQDAFEALQINAGILLNRFNPATGDFDPDDIITATTGGITASCVPTYSDYAADVDNAPNDLKEFKHLDGWNSTLATTGLGTSRKLIRMALGAADIDAETGAIKPRRYLKDTDFADLWFVGDRADGGLVAVKLRNALSTGGFVLKTTKNGKGQTSLTLTGHVSIQDQDTMPMEFYSEDPPEDEDFVDKTGLRQTIAFVGTLTEADYTSGSWTTLQTALTAANAVADVDADADQDDVDDADAALKSAIVGLVEA